MADVAHQRTHSNGEVCVDYMVLFYKKTLQLCKAVTLIS